MSFHCRYTRLAIAMLGLLVPLTLAGTAEAQPRHHRHPGQVRTATYRAHHAGPHRYRTRMEGRGHVTHEAVRPI